MSIKVGDKMPDASFKFMGADGPEEISTKDIFDGKKVVLFAVPGAFTPTCHLNHLPGYLKHLDEIKAKGVDNIAVVSVNDLFVMDAWAKSTGGKGKLHYLSDGAGTFTKQIGLDLDLSEVGLGVRSKRYSMIVDNGTVTALNIEEAPGVAELSGAAAILDQL
ncbi:MAG: peroxiredoxin [Salaquimonas sp.]